MIKINVSDIAVMQRVAAVLAEYDHDPQTVITLYGDLGVGKTTFTQFFLKSLGVESIIPSPTYNLVNAYVVNDHQYIHADFYRLDDEDSLDLLGWDLMIAEASVALIEWPRDFIVKPSVEIKIVQDSSNNYHRIMHVGAPKAIESLLKQFIA